MIPVRIKSMKFKESTFLKNIMIVMGGTATAQIISYSLSPVISRLFTPTHFGIFGSFTAVAGIISSFITLDYSQALMLPKEKSEAINLFFLSITSNFIICFLVSTIIIITPSMFYNLTKTKGLGYVALFIFMLIISGINSSSQAWAIRSKAFKKTSLSQVIRSLGSSSSRITFGFLKAGALGLIISSIFADFLATLNLLKVVIPDLRATKNNIHFSKMARLAREYIDFPLYSASQNFINSISSGIPVLLITKFYGLSAAGAYAFGISMLQAPMSLVLTALRQVLFQKACEFQHENKGLFLLYIRTVLVLFGLAIIPSLILIIWAPQLFSFIFGERWHLAGILARSLIIWMAFVFCNLPAIIFSRIIRIQRFVFFYDIVLLIARITTLVIGGLYLKLTQTVMAFALIGALMNLFLIYSVGRQIAKKESFDHNLSIKEIFT